MPSRKIHPAPSLTSIATRGILRRRVPRVATAAIGGFAPALSAHRTCVLVRSHYNRPWSVAHRIQEREGQPRSTTSTIPVPAMEKEFPCTRFKRLDIGPWFAYEPGGDAHAARVGLLALCLMALGAATSAGADDRSRSAASSSAQYKISEIEGWTVYVNERLSRSVSLHLPTAR